MVGGVGGGMWWHGDGLIAFGCSYGPLGKRREWEEAEEGGAKNTHHISNSFLVGCCVGEILLGGGTEGGHKCVC